MRRRTPKTTSDHVLTAVRGQCRAGDEARIVRGQEYDAARNLFRFAESADGELAEEVFLRARPGDPPGPRGSEYIRGKCIDGDAAARALLRQRLGEAEL